MSGGIVYSGSGNGSLGKFSAPQPIAAGAPIPPGMFFIDVGWNAVIDSTTVPMPAGIVQSDGRATALAAGNLISFGAGPPGVWPWPQPWPLNAMPWAPWP